MIYKMKPLTHVRGCSSTRTTQLGLVSIKACSGSRESLEQGNQRFYALRECKQQASPKKLVVASFFFHGRGADMQKTPLGLFRSLLHQILDQIPEWLSAFSSIFKK